MDQFDKFYKQLNVQQKNAVDSVEGPVMVVAGPGTGKTQILTLRIANILKKTDINPENILALTFTESGAASMRRRLAEIIGSPAYAVNICTFHGFCNDIIKNYPEEFPRIIGSAHITEVDQINIIEEIIEALPIKILKPFGDPLYYIKDILKAINDLKREGVQPEDFYKILKDEEKCFNSIEDLYHDKGPFKGKMKGDYQKLQKKIEKSKELAKIYEAYQENLAENKFYDYSDMIMEVLKELKANKNLLLILQEQYQYVLVDEHQDTNTAQNKIMELLCNFHNNPNIFVVGDEKQAIFRFQGASLENFMHFKKLYPEAKIIFLEENYRSTQNILDSAHSLLAGKKNLKANAAHINNKISLYAFERPETEIYFVAKDVKHKLAENIKPNEIAVLYRDNKDVWSIANMFEKMSIPFVVESDQDLMTDNDIKKIIILLRAAGGFGSNEYLAAALHIDFLDIAPLDVYKIINYANREKFTIFDVVKSKATLQNLELESAEKIFNFYLKLSSWSTVSKNKSLPEFFEILVRESGYLKNILSGGGPGTSQKLEKLNQFFDEIKSLAEKHKNYELKDFIKYLDTLISHGLAIKKPVSQISSEHVRLMTAHRAKGQEFEYVYIVNAYDGHWGNKRQMNSLELPASAYSISGAPILDSEEKNQDERRLFYVALTRAKKSAIITFAKHNMVGREQLVSQFVKEIKPELIEVVSVANHEKDFDADKAVIFAPSVLVGGALKDKNFVRENFIEKGISVTSLNNYLKCPWNYFYNNLVRIPGAKTKHQMYGTAVHGALKDFFKATAEKSKPDKKYLIDKFTYYLGREPLRESEEIELSEKGKKSLGGYYDFYNGKWSGDVLTEFKVEGVELSPEIKLTGKIDKIELGKEEAGIRTVNVVDYKTSKPKSRNEIIGETKNSTGDIKRQLVFYNLLLDKYKDGKKYKMVSGEIDFIEPDEKGRYKKEFFSVTPKEIEELEELIMKVSQEILNLDFWNKGCGKKDCEFCELRRAME